MGKFGFHVIDADGHGGDLPNWQERLPGEFRPDWERRRERIKSHFANLIGVGVKQTKGTAKVDSLERAGMTDPKARLEDMDLEGIDQTIMFPGGAGEEWAGLDRGFSMALCRTLNDARAEFTRYQPSRLKSVAKLPMLDPQAAAAELRRAVKELGMVGMVTPQHVRDKNLDHPSFDVVWKEAESLGVAVCVHGGGQAIDQVPIGVDRFKTRLETHAFTHPVGQMLAVMSFSVGGILHRFPKLRVAFLEANVGWLPFWLDRLDEHWELTPEQAPGIDRKPSEYILSGNCFIGCDPDERTIPYVVDACGEGVVVYASDYCHWDCAFPDTVKIIAERGDLSKSAKEAIFDRNPARLYGLKH
jgi:predicted TIM-barrel fold metal-dependent hydrolase